MVHRLLQRILPLALTLSILLNAAPFGAAPAAAQAGCQFKLGFATLRSMIGAAVVGSCLEDEHFNPANGNAEQRTANGLMVWRKADNWTAFTNGSTTWLN